MPPMSCAVWKRISSPTWDRDRSPTSMPLCYWLLLGELIGATWDEIDLDSATWIVPAERMKMKTEHVVPLSRQAVDVLRELKSLAGESRYVLPGRNVDKPISNNTMLFALYRLGYKNKMTGHGFRSNALLRSGRRAAAPESSTQPRLRRHPRTHESGRSFRRGS